MPSKAYIKSITVSVLLAAFISILFNRPVFAQPFFELPGKHKKAAFPFKLVRNLVVVQTYLNNKGPYNFVLDTGVGILLITDPSLIDSLDISQRRSIEVQGLASNERMEAWVTPSVMVSIDKVYCPSVPAAILKKDFFGLSAYAGMPIHGLLGYEFFSSFGVKFDFMNMMIVVTPFSTLKPLRNSERIPLSIEDRKPYIRAKIDMPDKRDFPVKLIVDLGAGHPLLLENMISGYIGMPNRFIVANLGVGLGGPINGYLSRIDTLTLGKFHLTGVITSFPAKDESKVDYVYKIKRDGNLGIGVLKRFTVLFDYNGGSLYLRKTGRLEEPFEHDMSGIEYYAGGKNFDRMVISRVEPGSAAYDAGLFEGDEIVGINFKKVGEMTVEEIDSIFRSRDERGLLLDIIHNKEQISLILNLKRRL